MDLEESGRKILDDKMSLEQFLYYGEILLILGAANFLPIIGRLLLGKRLAAPVDLGVKMPDGRPVFGPHKTWRGLAFSLAGTPVFSMILGFDPILGLKAAALSMIGDLAASFIKRRMGLESGAKATGLDQIIESALPLLVLRQEFYLEPGEVLLLVVAFMVLNITLSPILYRLKIRRNPY